MCVRVYMCVYMYVFVNMYAVARQCAKKWGGGTQTRDFCTFGKEPI